ncbi:MAG TPA: toll/interleukin-1 receptor domain-containing protein [Malonomonas sp.]
MGIFSRKHDTTATIRRIWHSPPPGAPWYYWTYVLFEARGQPIEVKLSKRQAKSFVTKNCEGDTGHLVYAGKDLVSWEKASAEKPIRPKTDLSIFVSYAHEWSDDAAYISQVFQAHGLNVWIDTGEVHTGDKLTSSVLKAIKAADYFVALLSPEYFASPWCIRELEAASDNGIKVLPIKVSEGKLKFPPHLKKLYEDELGEPVFLDIRSRDPSVKLGELAEQMIKQR